jgi:hypothetical protein
MYSSDIIFNHFQSQKMTKFESDTGSSLATLTKQSFR